MSCVARGVAHPLNRCVRRAMTSAAWHAERTGEITGMKDIVSTCDRCDERWCEVMRYDTMQCDQHRKMAWKRQGQSQDRHISTT